jgi:hypothetical protein
MLNSWISPWKLFQHFFVQHFYLLPHFYLQHFLKMLQHYSGGKFNIFCLSSSSDCRRWEEGHAGRPQSSQPGHGTELAPPPPPTMARGAVGPDGRRGARWRAGAGPAAGAGRLGREEARGRRERELGLAVEIQGSGVVARISNTGS